MLKRVSYLLYSIFFLFYLLIINLYGEENSVAEKSSFLFKELFPQFFNLFLFILVAYLASKKVVKELIYNRYLKVKNAFESSEREREINLVKYKEISEKINNIQIELDNIKKNIIEEGEKERKKIIENAEKISQKIIENAKIISERELNQAKSNIKKEVVNLAIDITKKILTEKLEEKDHEKLIQDSLKKIEEKLDK